MIQLPVVIARIAGTLAEEIDGLDRGESYGVGAARGPSSEELLAKLAESGAPIRTPRSGYLQVIRHDVLVKIATKANAVVQLPYRPGHFLVAGQVVAWVWPPEAADAVADRLALGHVTGAYRTLPQDISFGFDQLVEIALRALSPAVNDTFTGMTCVDWIADCLCRISTSWRPQRIRRDATATSVSSPSRRFRPAGRAYLRHHPSGSSRHARHHDSATRRAGQGHRTNARPQTPDALLREADAIQRSNLATVTDPPTATTSQALRGGHGAGRPNRAAAGDRRHTDDQRIRYPTPASELAGRRRADGSRVRHPARLRHVGRLDRRRDRGGRRRPADPRAGRAAHHDVALPQIS